MDMYALSTTESSSSQVQQPIGFASGAVADVGEKNVLAELRALGDRVSAARLIA